MFHTLQWLIFVWIIALVSAAQASQLYEICGSDALCRNLFQQEHGELSAERFHMLLTHLPVIHDMQTAENLNISVATADLHGLLADRMSLYHLIYNEQRCPPNQFWTWNATAQQGKCICYLDKDCRVEVLALCHPQVHFVLLACFIIVICFQAGLLVLNLCPARKTNTHKTRRA